MRTTARALVVCSVIVVAMTTASVAAAFVDDPISVQNWSSPPTGGCSVSGVLVGTCNLPPDAFTGTTLDNPDAAILGKIWDAAEVIPDPWWVPALKTIPLGIAAFAAGWEIGSVVNAEWLHINGAGLGVATPQIPNPSWTQTNSWPGSVVPVGLILQFTQSGWRPFTDRDYGCGSTAENPYVIAYGNSAAANVPGAVKVTIPPGDPLYWIGCLANVHAPMYELVIPRSAIGQALQIDQPLQRYTGQPNSITTGWADPSSGAGVTKDAPAFNSGPSSPVPCVYISGVLTCGTTPGSSYTVPPLNADSGYSDPDSNAFRHFVDPQNWAEPPKVGGEWSGTGGPKITIPDCHGATVSDCEAAIDNAIAATGATFHAAFPRMPAPTYDPSLGDGLVAGTDPAAGTVADPSSVTLEINETGNDCRTRTDYPHESTTTPASGMLVKGFVQCKTYVGPVTITTVLYECSAEPSGDTYDVLHANASCTEYAGEPTTITVSVTNKWFGKSLAFTSKPRDASKWYIGVTFGSSVEPSVSQLIEPTQ